MPTFGSYVEPYTYSGLVKTLFVIKSNINDLIWNLVLDSEICVNEVCVMQEVGAGVLEWKFSRQAHGFFLLFTENRKEKPVNRP